TVVPTNKLPLASILATSLPAFLNFIKLLVCSVSKMTRPPSPLDLIRTSAKAEDGVTEGWLYFSQLPEQIKKPYYDYNAEKWISASGN
ncbi:MAG: hypothetical protein EBW42_13555, partial [Rhodobacterales bacterium]|nr:hypothetical protein [Rhodobacterales bacterium]